MHVSALARKPAPIRLTTKGHAFRRSRGTILDSHIMAGVAPGREPESGGFADVDKADSASDRLISSLRRSPSAFVGARESCGPEMNGSVGRQSVSRTRDRVALRRASRRVAQAAATPLPALLATREAAGAPRARSSRRAVGPRRQAIPSSRTPCRAMASRSKRASHALDRDARLRSHRHTLRERAPQAP